MRKGTLLGDTLLLTASSVLLRGLGMLMNTLLSRAIGAEGLGILQLIMSVFSFSMTLGLCGTRTAALYFCASQAGPRADGLRAAALCCLRYVLFTACCAGTALFLFAPGLAGWLPGLAGCSALLRLLAPLLPVHAVNLVLGACFTAAGRVRTLIAVDLAERLFSSALFAALVLRGAAAAPETVCRWFLLCEGLGAALSMLALLVLFLRQFPPAGRTAQAPARLRARLTRLCIPLALGEYLRAGLSLLEQYLIPWGLLKSGRSQLQALGAYGTLTGMVFPMMMFPAALLYALNDLLVPALARQTGLGRARRCEQLIFRSLSAALLFASFCAGLFVSTGMPLARLLFDSPQAGRLLSLFAPMLLMLYLDILTDGMLKGLGQQQANLRINLLTSVLDVALLYLLLPRAGLPGYLAVFFLTHAVNFALSLRRLLQRCQRSLSPVQAVLPPACAALACAGAGLLQASGDWSLLFLRGLCFSVLFFCLAGLLGLLRGRAQT